MAKDLLTNSAYCPVSIHGHFVWYMTDRDRLIRQTREVIAIVEESMCLSPGTEIDWHAFIDKKGPELQTLAYADVYVPERSAEEDGECLAFNSYGIDITIRKFKQKGESP